MPQTMLVPFNGQEIGQGFNSETRENVGTALLIANVSEDTAADGQEVTTMFESVSTQESLMQSLGISASVDVRYGLFSGGAKVDFAESHAVNSFSSFIAGRSVVHNAVRHGHGIALSDDAKQLLSSERLDDFKLAFGDMFVRALKTGGEFDIVARVTSVSEEHQSKLAASLYAEYNGLVARGSFQASFETAMKETSSRTEVTVFMSQAGGIGAETSFTGPDVAKILDRLERFPASVHEHPVGYEAEVANYNTIPIPVPTAEEREDRQIVLADCFRQKVDLLRAISDLNLLMSENADLLFEGLPPASDLAQIQAQYRITLNQLMAHAIKVSTGRMDPPQTFVANPPPPFHFRKRPFVPAGPTPFEIQLTLDGVLLADNWRSAADLARMSTEDKRNTLIVGMSNNSRIPIPSFYQQFSTDVLVGKAGILHFLLDAKIRNLADLKTMSTDDQRNTLIVENAKHTSFAILALQGMTDQQLVQTGLSWAGR